LVRGKKNGGGKERLKRTNRLGNYSNMKRGKKRKNRGQGAGTRDRGNKRRGGDAERKDEGWCFGVCQGRR